MTKEQQTFWSLNCSHQLLKYFLKSNRFQTFHLPLVYHFLIFSTIRASGRRIVPSARSLNAVQSRREYLEGIWPRDDLGALNTAGGFAWDFLILSQTWSQEPSPEAHIWKNSPPELHQRGKSSKCTFPRIVFTCELYSELPVAVWCYWGLHIAGF